MPERTRVKSDIHTEPVRFVVRCNPGEPDHHHLTGAAAVYRSYTAMTDVVGNRKGVNPCFHAKVSGFPGYYGPSGLVLTEPVAAFQAPFNTPPGMLLGALPRLTESQIAEELQSAVTEWDKQMPAYADLGVFLGELRHGVKQCLPELADLSSTISSKFLKWQFGIKPVINDMKKFITVFGKFRRRMKYLHETHGKTARQRYRSRDFGPDFEGQSFDFVDYQHTGSGDEGSQFPAPPPCWSQWVDPLTVRVTYHQIHMQMSITGFVKNELQGLDNMWDMVDAFGAALGLNNPAKILWNLSPWSFVVDWFVDVDKYLDTLAGEPFGGKLILEGGHYSIKTSAYVKIEHIDVGVGSTLTYPGSYMVRTYDRRLGLGDASSDKLHRLASIDPFNGGLIGDRQWIAAALLDQRMRRNGIREQRIRNTLRDSLRKIKK